MSVAIGDTVSGEANFPVEDIDEFEFSGVAGQRLQALVTTQVGSAPGLAFQVFEPVTGRLVAAARVDHTQWELGPDRSQVFTLPSTGAYLVRVQWPVSQGGDDLSSLGVSSTTGAGLATPSLYGRWAALRQARGAPVDLSVQLGFGWNSTVFCCSSPSISSLSRARRASV